MQPSSSFAEILRTLRVSRQYTQEELAERARLGLDTISALERATRVKPRKVTVTQLADALALSEAEQAVFFAAARGNSLNTALALAPAPPPPVPWSMGAFWGALPDQPLVARASEWDTLSTTLITTMQGQGCSILLAGEPGIGKTRLGQELLVAARQSGYLTFVGRCYEPQCTVPYFPFIELLGMLIEQAPDHIRDQIGKRWSMVYRLLPGASVESELALQNDPADQQRILWTLNDLIHVLSAEVPVALAIDDLHWADEASLALWEHLARYTRDTRALVLGAYRDTEVSPDSPLAALRYRLEHERLLRHMVLRGLTIAGVSELIMTTLSNHGTDELCSDLHHLTAGNPFFVYETLLALQENNALALADGMWKRRKQASLPVAPTVRAMLRARLRHLSQETGQFLRQASIFGHLFAFEEVCQSAGYAQERGEVLLQEAIAAGFVSEAPNDRFLFRHVLVRDALYAELTTHQRRMWHRAAGSCIAAYPDHEERAGELLWHFTEGEAPEEALRYALIAARRSQQLNAHSEARLHLTTALELAQRLQDSASEAFARERLGVTLDILGHYDEALAALEQAGASYQQRGDITAYWRTLASLGRVHASRGTMNEGINQLQAALALCPEPEHLDREADHALALMALEEARLCALSGRNQEALQAVTLIDRLTEHIADEHIRALGAMVRGGVLNNQGRAREGAAAIEGCLTALEEADDLRNLSEALTTLIFLTSKLGAIADCYRYLEYALAVAHRLGDPAVLASVFFWRGWIAILTADFKQAEHDLQAAFDMRRQLGLQAHISESSFMLGILYKTMGQREQALAYFTEALALAQAHNHYLDLLYTHIELAEYELLAGQGAAAWERFQILLQHLERTGVPIEEYAYYFAWAASAAGETSIAQELLASCIVQLRTSENAQVLLDALRVSAHVALHTHADLASVRPDLDEALALTQAAPFPAFEVRVRYAYGLLATRQHEYPVAYQHFQEALVICERIGEGCYRPYVEQALAQLPHQQQTP